MFLSVTRSRRGSFMCGESFLRVSRVSVTGATSIPILLHISCQLFNSSSRRVASEFDFGSGILEQMTVSVSRLFILSFSLISCGEGALRLLPTVFLATIAVGSVAASREIGSVVLTVVTSTSVGVADAVWLVVIPNASAYVSVGVADTRGRLCLVGCGEVSFGIR